MGPRRALCQANIYFRLFWHSRSTQHPALRVRIRPSTILISGPWDPHPPQCSHRHFSWDCSIGLIQVYEFNSHILLSFQFLLYLLPQGKHPITATSVVPFLSLNSSCSSSISPYTTALILPSIKCAAHDHTLQTVNTEFETGLKK